MGGFLTAGIVQKDQVLARHDDSGIPMTNGFAPERLGGRIDTRRQGIAGVTITISTPPTRPVVGLSFSGVCR